MGIARDTNQTHSSSTSTSVSTTYTCSGSNRLLLVFVVDSSSSGGSVTGVTYNGVPMTKLVDQAETNLGWHVYIYGLLNPASGANTLTATRTANTGSIVIFPASYTGVLQSGLPDATTSGDDVTASNHFTSTLTTIADKCWTFLGWVNGSSTATAGTNATGIEIISNFGTADNQTYGDITPAGSFSMTINGTGSWGWAEVSFAPAPATTTSTTTTTSTSTTTTSTSTSTTTSTTTTSTSTSTSSSSSTSTTTTSTSITTTSTSTTQTTSTSTSTTTTFPYNMEIVEKNDASLTFSIEQKVEQ